MKTSISVILLIVGLAVGGLAGYMASSGQMSSLQGQISSMQTQVTTLQGSVSSLQGQLSDSQSQTAFLNQKLQGLLVPLVTVTSCPSTVSVGEHFVVTWNVTGGVPGNISHTGIHLDMSESDIASVVFSGDTPQTFRASVPAPNQTGTFAIRAHALIDGTAAWSEERIISVIQPNTFSIAISAERIVMNKADRNTRTFTVTVTSVGGFNSPVTLALTNEPTQLASEVTATLNPATVTPPANGKVTSTLSLVWSTSGSGGTFAVRPTFGTYALSVTGTSGSVIESDALQVIITNPTSAFAVAINGFTYGPSTITIPVGGTVTWTNQDPVTHTATSSKGLWDSGDIAPGQSVSYTFNTVGSYAYADANYPYMTGTVIVTP